jgi:hypothetical protein
MKLVITQQWPAHRFTKLQVGSDAQLAILWQVLIHEYKTSVLSRDKILTSVLYHSQLSFHFQITLAVHFCRVIGIMHT